MRQIATAVGCSLATVSRALRSDPRVRPPLAEHIRQTAHLLGYERDPALVALVSRRWNGRKRESSSNLAFLSFEGDDLSRDAKPSVHAFLQGVQEEAKELGFALDCVPVKGSEPGFVLADQLEARGVHGLILGRNSDPHFRPSLPWNRFYGIIAFDGFHLPAYSRVGLNIAAAFELIWSKAHQAGYRRPGLAFVDSPAETESDRLLFGALRRIEHDEGRTIPVLRSWGNESQTLIEWVETHALDVVLGFTNTFYWTLKAAGIQMPEHLGFVSLQNSDNQQNIAGARVDGRLLGRRSVRLLEGLMRDFKRGPSSVREALLLEPEWVPGRTLGQTV